MSTAEDALNEEKDREEMGKLLREINQGAKETRKVVQNLMTEIKGGVKSEGISFLDLKNRLLASYSSNLGLLMLRKCEGGGLEGEPAQPAVKRLVETRTVLEKIRPIDQKLRYQVDKLVAIAEKGTVDQNDPLRFKPGALLADESESEDETKDPATEKFKVPMNVPQFYNEGRLEERTNMEEKTKKKAISRSIMESIKEQYLDTPEEVSHKVDVMRKKMIDEESERTRIEEEHFIRLPVTKADRLRRKQMMTMGSLGEDMTSFGHSNFDDSAMSGKKRKKSSGGSGKKKGSKKFKKRM